MTSIARSSRRVRMAAIAAVVAGITIALSGCAEGSGADAVRVPLPADLVGRWVTGTSYTAPEVPFLLIAADGSWTGSDGCNGAEGEWSIDGTGGLTVSMGMRTEIYCEGVDLPLMFVDAVSASVDGGRLRLFDDKGFTSVKLAKSTVDQPASSGGPAATWGTPPGGTATGPYLTLAEDGTLTGNDGCNTMSGSWSADGDAVSFAEVTATMMGCSDVDTWLSGLGSAEVVGDELVIVNADGAEIGRLARAA